MMHWIYPDSSVATKQSKFWQITAISLLLTVFLALIPTRGIASTSADDLNQQGFSQLQQGNPTAALSLWRQSTQDYEKLENSEGIAGTKINQTLALQALGLNRQACQILIEVLPLPDWLCSTTSKQSSQPENQLDNSLGAIQKTPTNTIGLRALGDVLRSLGKLPESKSVLNQALISAQQNQLVEESSRIQASLAATHRVISEEIRNNFLRADDPDLQESYLANLQETVKIVLATYNTLINQSHSLDSETLLQSIIRRFDFLVDLEDWLEMTNSYALPKLTQLLELEQVDIVSSTLPLVQPNALDSLSTIEAIYLRLNLAQSLIKSRKIPELNQLTWQANDGLEAQIKALIERSQQQSSQIQNVRALSYSYGTYGLLLESTEAPIAKVQAVYEQAANLAQSSQSWDSAYQWQQALGQLYVKQEKTQQAINAYQAALENVGQVRTNLATVNPELQFSFQEKVEPIYRGYLKLLAQQPNHNLAKIVEINESLQIAELENYLGCGQLGLVSLNEVVSPTSPIIHVIDLGEETAIIIQLEPNVFHEYRTPTSPLKLAANNLLINLQSPQLRNTDTGTALLPYAKTLYQALIQPLQTDRTLPKTGTLVFVLDSSLQNIPMGILHDGEKFLLENYSITVALGSQVRSPQPLNSNKLQGIIAGISERSPSFGDPRAPQNLQPLPEVEFEIQNIKTSLPNSQELLNQQFTAERLQSEISTKNYPILHLTTHGQFSSDPSQTLLLSWNRVIDGSEINDILRSQNQTPDTGINLLVLSACQTAKGDRRSALGIAGIATQAGARSTVATLWKVDADSTGVLMHEFYAGLKSNLSKAESLRQAQLTLLMSDAFKHPYYWACFTLIGNWL